MTERGEFRVEQTQENVKDVTNCFTRLRFELKDDSKASKEVVSRIEGVIDVVEAAGQF